MSAVMHWMRSVDHYPACGKPAEGMVWESTDDFNKVTCPNCEDRCVLCRDSDRPCVGDPVPEQSTIAAEAHAAVYGDRGKDYGHPRDNFTDTARIWNALLHHKLSADITPEDVARCMIGIKLARDLHSAKRDNRVDMVGYAITLDRLETGH